MPYPVGVLFCFLLNRKKERKKDRWGGWAVGGCQTGDAGSFPRTKREVFSGTKIYLFEFGVKYLNFGATYLSFGAT